MGLEKCKLIELPVVANPQGNLVFAEAEAHVPFPIARTFCVYDIPSGAARGGHAHFRLEEAVFCLAGSLEMVVDDGVSRHTYRLEHPYMGLYVPPLIWHDIGAFSEGTVYMGLASTVYEEDDYIRDYEQYLATTRAVL
ncbi:MAG TPA: FdtA/QdtA family cupin domain-containing protein [Solirubrobacterales bacterium]|nr:FdtA/QdtA family cupin domain-containing protein [Solirubrobacterales bacterium]